MAQYGEVRVDFITYTTGVSPEANVTVPVSGLVNSPTFSGNVIINSGTVENDLIVSGNIDANTITATGDVTLGDNLTVSGNINANTINTTGEVNISGNTTITGSLTVTGDTTLSGGLTVTGDTQLNQNVFIGSGLTVTGVTTLLSGLSVGGDTTISGALTVTGDTQLNQNVFIGSGLTVTGDVNTSGTLNVTGTTNIFGDLDVSGVITLEPVSLPAANSTRLFARDTDNAFYLQTATGNRISFLDGDQDTMANFTPSGLTFNIDNSAVVLINDSGNVELGGDAFISGDATVTGELNVSGNADIRGDVQMTSQNGNALAGLRNVLINGSFQVWQRGTTLVNAGGQMMTADMWRETGNVVGASVSRSRTAPAGLPFSAVLNNSAGFLQTGIELPEVGAANNGVFALNSTWTLSVWATKNLTGFSTALRWRNRVGSGPGVDATSTINFSESPNTPASNGFTRYQITFEINNNNPGNISGQNVEVLSFALPSGSTTNGVSYAGVQLEPGPVATPNENRPIGLELELCQRYLQLINISRYKPITIRGSNSGNAGAQLFALTTTMRELPTSPILTSTQVRSFTGLNQSAGVNDPNTVNISIGGTGNGNMYTINFGNMGSISNNELQIVALYDTGLQFPVSVEL